ncbi:hypothetical protein Fot_53947 [Forsythia ovata]|uniref:Uncharacterized protein n=1 Tax=Forsythia ovata TaxID=205694 RepID=A0ABD1PFM5_9LAMI
MISKIEYFKNKNKHTKLLSCLNPGPRNQRIAALKLVAANNGTTCASIPFMKQAQIDRLKLYAQFALPGVRNSPIFVKDEEPKLRGKKIGPISLATTTYEFFWHFVRVEEMFVGTGQWTAMMKVCAYVRV